MKLNHTFKSRLRTHYKDKPYLYLGEVVHSETLEKLVLYKTLYKNDLGSDWVRPKEMFFENVQIENQEVPRFAQKEYQISVEQSPGPQLIEEIGHFLSNLFDDFDTNEISERIDNSTNAIIITARHENTIVGCKIGYSLNQSIFYSWLGGVLQSHRRGGIAQDLMTTMIDWCRSHSYQKLSTKTLNRFKEMLILNIKNDFRIVGTELNELYGIKILLEKDL